MTQNTADRQLIERMRQGQERAFDQFFREYLPRTYRFVLPRVGRDASVAEEVCQEVLSRAMRNIDGYRGEAALFTWLCQMARNAISDHWRRQQRRDRVEVFVEDDPAIAAALESLEGDPGLRPEVQQARGELLRLVQVALDGLPGSYGDALEWKYIDGLSVAEIADRLGQSVIATQSLLQRARGAFREAFGELSNAARGA
ncbi:MAG: RNA polymerase sigma factor [Nevskiaceae bacterium]|nr:RNA polymerase sigma factor [Nevskiaceae bacterium]